MKTHLFFLSLIGLFTLTACEKDPFRTPEELIVGRWQLTTYQSNSGSNMITNTSEVSVEMQFDFSDAGSVSWYVALTDKKTGGVQSATHYGAYTITSGLISIDFPNKGAFFKGNLNVSDKDLSITGQVADKNGNSIPITVKGNRN